MEQCFSNKDYVEILTTNPSLPQEENDNVYIFWCLRPRKLAVPLKMSGDHQIWKLHKGSLSAAQRGLQPVRWPAPGEGEQAMNSPSLPAGSGGDGGAGGSSSSGQRSTAVRAPAAAQAVADASASA